MYMAACIREEEEEKERIQQYGKEVWADFSVYHPGLNWTRLDWMGKGHFRVKMFERV